MNYNILIWVLVVAVAFGVLWWSGQLVRLKKFWDETYVELQKCTWPTWAELRGSTIVVFISIAILGLFTGVIDWIMVWCVRHIV